MKCRRRIWRGKSARKQWSRATPPSPERHTGYQVGGTSPFGTRKGLPVYVEASILDLPRIYINGGKRGFLVALAPADLVRVLSPTTVEAAQEVAK